MKKLREIFNDPYPFEKHDYNHQSYNFHTNMGHGYDVDIDHHSNFGDRSGKYLHSHAVVAFGAEKSIGLKGRFRINKSEPNSAHKVFGTVKTIINHHLKKHPEIKTVGFNSYHDEPSRVKLYHTIAKSIDPGYGHKSEDNNTRFTLKSPHYKESK